MRIASFVLLQVIQNGEDAKVGDVYCANFAREALDMSPRVLDTTGVKLQFYLNLILAVRDQELSDESKQEIVHLLEGESAEADLAANRIASALKPIPKTVFPRSLVASTTAVDKRYRMGELTTGKVSESYAVPVNKNDVNVYVTTSFNQLAGVSLSQRIDDDAMNTYNAVVSLQAAGNRYFTESQLAQVLSGKNPNKRGQHISDKTIKRFYDNLVLLSHTYITIDASQQLVDYKDLGIAEVRFTGPFLPLDQMTVKQANGQVTSCWHIISDEMPVLYRYSASLGQISKIDINLLNTDVSETKYTTSIKLYLLRQINGMINGWRKNHKILYDSMFEQCGLNASEEISEASLRKTRNRLISQHIPAFCDYWVSMGFITGYKLHDGPKAKDGLVVYLPPKSKRLAGSEPAEPIKPETTSAAE